MIYELTLDSDSNVKKIVNKSKALYANGNELEYNHKNKRMYSERGNLVKTYIHTVNEPHLIPKISNELPHIVLNNGIRGHYAILKDGSEIISKEWYFAFKNKDDFLNVYFSLDIIPPKGYFWDLFLSDVNKHRFRGSKFEYDYCLSVELKSDDIIIDWYMSVGEEEYNKIIKEWK